jgi:hypothetical protein
MSRITGTSAVPGLHMSGKRVNQELSPESKRIPSIFVEQPVHILRPSQRETLAPGHIHCGRYIGVNRYRPAHRSVLSHNEQLQRL